MTAPLLPQSTAIATGVGSDLARRLVEHVERVVVGKRTVVQLAVVTLLSGGHMLVEDVPGVGKTLLARALARAVGGAEARVQGAPDLLPTDLTGGSVWRPAHERFEFLPGPLFANVVLVDEVNRMPPRTQAALLEAMQEGQVSVDGATHALPQPHLVIATQNPVEQHGTFPLPEAQLDRFTAATAVGYPTPEHEVAIITGQLRAEPLATLAPLMDIHQLAALQAMVREVTATVELVRYAVRVTTATREAPEVRLGASPRASLQLVRAAQALALLDGRDHVLPDDVQRLSGPVLAHRLVMGSGGPAAALDLVTQLLRQVPVTLR